MTQPDRLEFSLAKAMYLFSYTTAAGEGGDKRKFWRDIMGFQSAAAIREAILAQLSVELLQPQDQNLYGERYQAPLLLTGPSGVTQEIQTGWIVLFNEEIARFVAYPKRSRRQQ